jgi:hypothetical protein
MPQSTAESGPRLYLRVGVDSVEVCASDGIPESDAAVGSATPRRQKVALKGAPGQGLHSRLVGGQSAV